MGNHREFYSFAEYYDIAFDFKDVPKECEFLLACYQALHKNRPGSFFELAAGPALHAREMAKRSLSATAMDLSPQMVEYGRMRAEQEGLALEYSCSDMVDFHLKHRFDVAALLMDSASYLLTNEAVLSHLNAVAEHLNPGGLYVLEMAHPRDIFDLDQSTQTKWEMSRDGIKVKVQWGSEGDEFNPVTQVAETTVHLEVTDKGEKHYIKESAPQRCFTANEFRALVAASGKFEIVESFGAMDRRVPFNNDKRAWRMVSVLQKV